MASMSRCSAFSVRTSLFFLRSGLRSAASTACMPKSRSGPSAACAPSRRSRCSWPSGRLPEPPPRLKKCLRPGSSLRGLPRQGFLLGFLLGSLLRIRLDVGPALALLSHPAGKRDHAAFPIDRKGPREDNAPKALPNPAGRFRLGLGGSPAGLRRFGEVPEWLKGTDCKSVGYAYAGSKPALSTKPVSLQAV